MTVLFAIAVEVVMNRDGVASGPRDGDAHVDRATAAHGAPAPDLYAHFGLTADAITPKILEKLGL
jgi:hypothetical protein